MRMADGADSTTKKRFGTIAAWASALATLEQVVESGVPALRASMMHAYPAKMFAQLSFAILFGVVAGHFGQRKYYWLAVVPLLWFLMLGLVVILGEG